MRLCKPSWVNHDGHPIFSIDIHPDDTRFVTGGQGEDSTGRVVIWNLKAIFSEKGDTSIPRMFCQLDHHSACVNCVRWSNSGRFLASGGDDKVIIIWKLVSKYTGNSVSTSNAFGKSNLEVWKTVSVLRSHEGDVLDLAWSSEDTYLASCSVDNTVIIWNAQNFPQIVTVLKGHTSMVKGVTWDPIGKYIATQSEDKTLRIWRTSDWTTEHIVTEPFTECGGTTHVLRLGWSPDGLYLLSAHAMNCGGPTAQIVEREGWKTDKDFVGHRKSVVCVRFNKNIVEKDKVKQCYVALGSRDRSISVWSTALKRPVVVIKDAFTHSVMDLTWSHCGNFMLGCSWDGTVIVFEFFPKELGRSLTQDEKVSLYQRFYGESVVTNNTQAVIPNIEIFLARQSINSKKQQDKVLDKIEPEECLVIVNEEVELSTADKERLNKGPTKQIETRTADGKRRITPKFLPLTEDDYNSTTQRDESVVFQTQIQDNPSSHNQESLREAMVSNIDDISFGEHKGNNADIKTIPLKTVLKSPLRLEPEKTKTDSSSEAIFVVENGVQSSGDSSSDKKTENVQKKRVPLQSLSAKRMNGHDDKKDTMIDTESSKSAITNGCASDTHENNNNASDKIAEEPSSHKSNGVHIPLNALSNKDSVALPIQVKRKRRLTEEMKPPQSASKKRLISPPVGIMTPPIAKTNISDNVNSTVLGEIMPTPNNKPITIHKQAVPSTNHVKQGFVPKSRLPHMKIDSVSCLQVTSKPENSYTLEVKNKHLRNNVVCHELKCKHFPTSLDGLEWMICTDAPICGILGDMHRIVAVCEDATLHIIDIKGRYAMSPMVLSSYPSKIALSSAFLLIITTKACLHMWNIHNRTVVIKSESLLPLLNQPGNESNDKTVDVVNVYIAAGGVPAITLSNAKSFMFNKDMCIWTLFSDAAGLVSSPLMPEAGDITSLMSLHFNRRKKPEPAVLSHIKLQLIKATEMKKAETIKQWILALAKTLASHGLDKELHLLCEDLLGPTHSLATNNSWQPLIGGCVDKRTTLREILDILLEDLKWQDLYSEFDELLKELRETNNTASNILES